jgi:hypothetical protein
MNPEMEDLFDQPIDSTFDAFGADRDQFHEDVHGLILETLKAALERLHERAEAELNDLNAKIKNTGRQFFVDQHVDVLARNAAQERFLRNMALVALASSLTHTLRKMIKNAWFRKKEKKKYGTGADSEFQRLWLEYSERFDFKVESDLIAFTDTMRKVRNQIVHDGGEANPFKEVTFEELNLSKEETYLDLSFSKAYPDFVTSSGMNGEVEVSQKQLEEMVGRSIALVEWLAVSLRTMELAYIEALNKRRDEEKKKA